MRTMIFSPIITVMLMCFNRYPLTGPAADAARRGFAVVELFTSEGCSSCPPADEAVAGLAKRYDSGVYILCFHVDYWNYLGWTDAFSDAAWSRRQKAYGGLFRLNSIYTPQVIINGETEFVGSDKDRLQQTVEKDLKAVPSTIIALSAKSAGNNIEINYRTGRPAEGVLNFALIQLQAQTHVQRGENSGKILHHINIVRDFKTIRAEKETGKMLLSIPDGLDPKDCRVIAYLQNSGNWHVIAANETKIF